MGDTEKPIKPYGVSKGRFVEQFFPDKKSSLGVLHEWLRCRRRGIAAGDCCAETIMPSQPTPPKVPTPPSEIRINKALLKETNG